MVTSLATASAWLEETECVVSYGDILYHPDIVTQLSRAEGEIAIAYDRLWQDLWSRRFADPLEDAETFAVDGQGRLLDIGGRAQAAEEIQGQYMGLLKFTQSGWSRIVSALAALPPERRESLDMTGLLSHLLEKNAPIQTTNAPWQHDWRW
jgi:choline kinase